MAAAITEHVCKTPRHTTYYLACGPANGPLVIFVHGWPEMSISWRNQLSALGALGFRAVAPDMRGYGRSTVHGQHADYSMEQIVGDMRELLDHLRRDSAIWVGHDWGSPVVWSLASHHPETCPGLASLCVPYQPHGFSLANLIPLLDRKLYPEDKFPAGQWDYHLYYEEHFDKATAAFEANVLNTVKAMFRRGDPAAKGKPSMLSMIRRNGGWFGPAGQAPDLPLDRSVMSEQEMHQYAGALERNGFFGPDSWYMNADRNTEYATRSVGGGRLSMPVLFMHAAYDYVCETVGSRLADPMREACTDLAEVTVNSGHWMAQEQPEVVNAALVKWLATRFPALWPV